MTGLLRCRYRAQDKTAVLDDDGRWHCQADPQFAAVLDALSGRYLDPESGMSMGNPLVAALIGMAQVLDGTYEIEPKTPHPSGTVY